MNVYVYVDGFNLYYRALKGTPFKWLNLVALSQTLVKQGDTIKMVRIFTARVSSRAGDPDAPRRQQLYFRALQTLPEVKLHMGRFLSKTIRRPLVANPAQYVEVLTSEEKGSDVNLAVHLLNDGWHGRYDTALVLSQDTDLIEPIRIAAKELHKNVGLIWLDQRRADKNMAAAASFTRHITTADLRACQFPDPVVDTGGQQISKPATW